LKNHPHLDYYLHFTYKKITIALRYALEELDVLITITLRPELIKEKSITDDLKKEWISAAEKSKESIRIFLMRKSVDIEKEKALELLIQQYQSSVIILLDKVYSYLSENKGSGSQDLYKSLLRVLEDILSNIEHRYTKYFNQEGKVPDIYLQLSRNDIQQKIKPLKKRLREKENDEKLIELAFSSVQAFSISRTKKIITYRRLMYIKDSIAGLEELCREDNFTNKSMIALLVYMNFNCSRFVTYCIDIMEGEVNNIPEKNGKLDKLAHCLKKINQMQEKPGVAFKQNNESVKQQVVTWINEEIYFLEHQQRLFSPVPYLKEDALITDEQKLHLSVSVDVMTLLARSAKDSRLILNKGMAGMFRNISQFCRTKNAENPSPTSMLNKSYVAERNNKKAAIDILHEMIKNINRYCFVPLLIYNNFFDGVMDVVL